MPESIAEWKPRPRNRVFIRLSGGRFFTIPESETIEMRAGMVLSDEDIERLARIDQYFRGKEKALRLLAIRSRTRHEIQQAIDGLSIDRSIRNGIVEELIEAGLIDDNRFAREFVRSRIETKHLGPHRLKFELGKLGISGSIVTAVLDDAFTPETEEEIAWRLVRKKLGTKKPEEKDVRRIAGLLRRKGLDYEVVNRVAYQLLQQSHNDRTFD